MVDAFGEGFLDTIVGVHWRSGPPPIPKFSWIAIEQIGAINAFVTTNFTVSVDGGVGSFTLFSGTQNGAGWSSEAHTPIQPISGGMINGSLSPSGGITSVNGFEQAENDPFAIPHTFLFLKLDDKLPPKTFKVTVTNNISGAIGASKMTIRAVVMKAIVEGDTIYPTISSQVLVNKAGMNHVPSIFTFDRKKLTVTGG